ncbi:hypothetical protein [Dinghuibacter silviterrae]|uniref:Annexin n=1 Tax=Dinghuibacter silviterrae TaxID=1539049 RepID=A0A4R8DVP5_9BACT|nr:hypothetical protein [Dinghuibacter silviterrae]TDX01487.1 hypothetical protein EDB95_2523 [Dinghuibacter silviterrae]
MPDTSAHHPENFTFKEKLQYTLLGLVVIGGSFYLGRSLIRKAVSTTEERNTFIEGNPAAYAQQIRMAFENNGWWGVDTQSLRQILVAIPSVATFKKVMTSYQRLFNRSLMMDMKQDLKTTEYNEMLAILSSKPARGTTVQPVQLTAQQYQSWAQRLKAAFDRPYGPFTYADESAIQAVVMEIPSQGAYKQLGLVYKAMYGNELDGDLRYALSFWEYPSIQKMITDKPS